MFLQVMIVAEGRVESPDRAGSREQQDLLRVHEVETTDCRDRPDPWPEESTGGVRVMRGRLYCLEGARVIARTATEPEAVIESESHGGAGDH